LVAKNEKNAMKKYILLFKISFTEIKRHYLVCVTSKNDKSQTAVLKSEMAVSKIYPKNACVDRP